MRFGRFLVWFFRPLFYFLFPYKILGRENIPLKDDTRPIILCSNHISDFDPVFLLMAFKKRPIYFMAKAELFPNRIATWFFTSCFGAFPVSRGKGDTAAIERAVELVKQGKLMGIYPEGTRSRDGRLGRAKSGAALIAGRCGASILPVAMVAAGQKIRLFHRTTVVIGPLIPPADLHLEDPEHPDLRFASRRLMEIIDGMIDAQRAASGIAAPEAAASGRAENGGPAEDAAGPGSGGTGV